MPDPGPSASDDTIRHLAPDTLRPWTRNARTHSKKQIRQIADSIRTFGFTNPVLIDEGNTILAGHGRVAAAKLLGLDRTREQLFETIVEYKLASEARIAEARRLGLPEPDLLPHPDDLIVDPIAGSVISKGPWTQEERAEREKLKTFKAGLEEDLRLEQTQPPGEADENRIDDLKSIVSRLDELLNTERVIVAPTAE